MQELKKEDGAESKKNFIKDFLILLVAFAVLATPLSLFIYRSFLYAAYGWMADPIAMVSKIIFSFIFGQLIFWLLGYDQFGLFMKTVKEFGVGQKIANYIAQRLPLNALVCWIVKAVEILTDAGKIPIEGLLYLKIGFVPDALATLVTQPAWSTFETAEKITGAIVNSKAVTTPKQLRVSLACIYGSLFRYLLAGLLWVFGIGLYQEVGLPIEAALRAMVSFF